MTESGNNITIHGGETPEISGLNSDKAPKHVTVHD